MKKRQIIIVLIAISIVVSGYFINRWLVSMKELPQMRTPPTVRRFVPASEVDYGTVRNVITEHGRISSANAIDLVAEGQGTIANGDVALKSGAGFRKGQVIYRIDDIQPRLALQAQKSGFTTRLASVLAELRVDNPSRYELWHGYAMTIDHTKPLPKLPEFANEKERMFFAARGITADYYNILANEERLLKYTYRAPFDGSFAQVHITAGSMVNIGTRIARIVSTDFFEMELHIAERDVRWLSQGMDVTVHNENGNSWDASILRIGNVIDPQTQSILVTIGIRPKGGKLFDGQYMRAEIIASDIENAYILPRKAILDNNKAWLVEDDKLVEALLDIVRLTETEAIIRGVAEASMIVTDPITNAYSGMDVTIIGGDGGHGRSTKEKPDSTGDAE